MHNPDFLIIGGGVIGLSIARGLKKSFTDARIVLIEKEPQCGMHASGRNSGVLHAGFYYSPDSLKARYTRQGNALLTDYCQSRNIKINQCGKLVVAKDESEHQSLDELLRRGRANEVSLEDISEEEARAIEPRVKTCGRALFSPTTASVDPSDVMSAMKDDAVREGVSIASGVAYLKKDGQSVVTSGEVYRPGYVVNAAGLYADRIAQDFGFSQDYRILPFKGLYLYSDEPPFSVRTNVYPVPDLRNPFLGVHYTVAVDGTTKIGPTAIPVLWREHYSGLENFKFSEFADIIFRQTGLLMGSDFDFKKLAFEEIRKSSRLHLVALASELMTDVDANHYRHWGRPGIRAQLMNIRTKRLEMDFVLEGDKQSMHVLNAVSPAFTCSLPFAEYVCDEISRQLLD
jgi:L-2-hydroxyglutarate oxidase